MSKRSTEIGIQPLWDINELPVGKRLLLGLQHTFAMFGATILVPILTGLNINTALLMAGIGTLIFHFITKGKVPAFLGSSFAFIAGYNYVAPLTNGVADPAQLAKACGGIFVSGVLYLIIAGLIKGFGVEKVMRFFPPVVTGPIIIAIGLTLSPSAIQNAETDWLLAIIAIVIVVIVNIWGRGMIKILPILLGIVGSYIAALIMGRVDFSLAENAKIFEIPVYRETFATFDLSAIITIFPIALATIMEHIGDIAAIGATTGKNYIREPGLHRTLMGDGVATMFASFFGGPANTTYGENTGVLALTRVYDPKVTRIAAVFAIILSFFPFFSSIIRSIPISIIGGVSMILYGMISAIGIRNLIENRVDFTKSRNLIVASFILVLALGFSSKGLDFTVFGADVHLSGIAIAAIVGILLNAILPGKDYNFDEENPQDTGVEFSTTDTTKEGRHSSQK